MGSENSKQIDPIPLANFDNLAKIDSTRGVFNNDINSKLNNFIQNNRNDNKISE